VNERVEAVAATPVDEIRFAITRLEGLKLASTGNEWMAHPVGIRADIRDADGRDSRGDAIATAADSEFGALLAPDADLVVTLHRTIDAQLAILTYAANGVRLWERVPYAVEVDLARAINGTAK